MDLSLDERQQQLRTVAKEFVAREYPREKLTDLNRSDTGLDRDTWRQAADIGILGALIAPDLQGTGNSLTDTAVIFEELGKAPVPGPFFSSAVLGTLIIQECGSPGQRSAMLPTLGSGQEIVSLAINEPSYGWRPDDIRMSAKVRSDGYVLNGTKLFVHDVMAATKFLCVARTETLTRPEHGLSVFIVDANSPGLHRHIMPGFLNHVGELRFEAVQVPQDSLLGDLHAAWPHLQSAFQKAIPVLAAFKVGGCEAVFQLSVEYSRSRIAFGVPIGRFQRVQDHIIEIVNRLDAARWTTYEALWKLDTGRPAAISAHLAKVVASEGYYDGCNYAHEAHGGIGTSYEYGLVAHTTMSRSLYHQLGDPQYHRGRLAKFMGAQDYT